MLADGLPKAVVFDLDGCLWYPDMYMLWGGGAPFTVRDDGDLDDSAGARTYLLGAVRSVLYELKTDARWDGVVLAVASCTDEPSWAQECMHKFEVGPVGSGVSIKQCMQIEEIRKANKRVHLTNIAEARAPLRPHGHASSPACCAPASERCARPPPSHRRRA